MTILLEKNISEDDFNFITGIITDTGFVFNETEDIIRIPGNVNPEMLSHLNSASGIKKIINDNTPFFTAYNNKGKTVIRTGKENIGSDKLTVIAGPCSVENEEHIYKMAEIVAQSGAGILRGGAFKPRTSPYSFRGLGIDGLKFIRGAADSYGLQVVTEIMSPDQIDIVYKYTDIFQTGARNMYNYPLLEVLSKTNKPVLLKRGFSATIDEFLMSAEYLMAGGNEEVILCERGIRTFETSSRFTLDLSSVPVIRERTHLPVIIDPSHAAGKDKYVPALAKAAAASGADGIMLEIHDNPDSAFSDGMQALTPDHYLKLIPVLHKLKEVAENEI